MTKSQCSDKWKVKRKINMFLKIWSGKYQISSISCFLTIDANSTFNFYAVCRVVYKKQLTGVEHKITNR